MRESNRRDFLVSAGGLAGGAWLAAQFPAIASAASAAKARGAFEHLTVEEAQDIEALADRILPGGETPGARDAGAIWFIDAAMGGFMAGAIGGVRAARGDLDRRAEERFGVTRFSDLDPARQDELMPAIAEAPWFGLLHLLTMAGTLTMPSQGGNRDSAGWALIGFDHRHAWQPPFGFYDREANSGEAS